MSAQIPTEKTPANRVPTFVLRADQRFAKAAGASGAVQDALGVPRQRTWYDKREEAALAKA